VRSKIGHRLSRRLRRPSLAGRGVTERMRSTTFALLGITAAAGLGLVAIFSQQGWPLLTPSPLPSAPGGSGAIGDAMVVARHTDGAAAGELRDRTSRPAAALAAPPAPRSGSADLGAQSPSPPPELGGAAEPRPLEASEPRPAPVAETPAPAPEQVASIPASVPAPPTSASPGKPSKASVDPPGEEEQPDDDGPPTDDPPEPEPVEEEPPPAEESGGYHGHWHGHGYGHWRHGE
jgi:hypothetical protein